MTFRVRFTREAEEDLVRLCELNLDREVTGWALAERALEAIRHAVSGLEHSRSAIGRPAANSVHFCANSSFPSARQVMQPFSRSKAATWSRFSPYVTSARTSTCRTPGPLSGLETMSAIGRTSCRLGIYAPVGWPALRSRPAV